MRILFEFLATFCAGMFAGAATYITLVEHPARMACGTALAATEFGPSYRRATILQVALAIAGFAAAIASFALSSNHAWLLGAILIVAVIPFTLVAILPTNKKLLDPTLNRDSAVERELLVRWGRLHAVRTALSLAAFVVLVLATMPGLWGDAAALTADSVLGAREAVLRQDLWVLRSEISQYKLDKREAPNSLDDLVRTGYRSRFLWTP